VQDMWEKWVFLTCLGAITTLMRAPVGDINAAPGGAAFTARIGAEAVAVVTAAGHAPRPKAVEILQGLLTSTEATTSSMYRDMAQGRQVEADAIVGDFVGEAAKHDVPVPLLAAAHTNLSVYGAGRAG
jgi:2-dehydropantoate 2-reductase